VRDCKVGFYFIYFREVNFNKKKKKKKENEIKNTFHRVVCCWIALGTPPHAIGR
jgi:hypothetical protein